MTRAVYLLVFLLAAFTGPLQAQDFSALARVDPADSRLMDADNGVELRLNISQGVPYRTFFLGDPRRLVIDFNELDFAALPRDGFDLSDIVSGYRVGPIAPGWSRMVLAIKQPLAIETAALTTSIDGRAQVFVRLMPTDAASFDASVGTPDNSRIYGSGDTSVQTQPRQRQTGDAPLIVVLDPGHGGIDPGAVREGVVEADLMLTFARELKEALLRAGDFKVILTRGGDDFVPLEARVTIARSANADVFISLHADALVEGRASGSTVYTLSETATDIASQKLAERHDRGDLLAGVDLSAQDDVIAGILMDLARSETAPRSDNLAKALVVGMTETVGMHKRPHLSAGFSVLKAPDIPSVLLELGFLSSKRDRDRLNDVVWRALAAEGIVAALRNWAVTDAADAQLLRK